MYKKLLFLLGINFICSGIIPTDAASPVNISLSARDLPPFDPFGGYPDPYVIVFYAFGSTGKYQQVGKTAAIADTQNPNWVEVIKVDDFVPGTSQRLRFEVWDEDLDGDDLMGSVEFYLAELSNAANGTLLKDLDVQGNGRLIVENVARQNLTKTY